MNKCIRMCNKKSSGRIHHYHHDTFVQRLLQ